MKLINSWEQTLVPVSRVGKQKKHPGRLLWRGVFGAVTINVC